MVIAELVGEVISSKPITGDNRFPNEHTLIFAHETADLPTEETAIGIPSPSIFT